MRLVGCAHLAAGGPSREAVGVHRLSPLLEGYLAQGLRCSQLLLAVFSLAPFFFSSSCFRSLVGADALSHNRYHFFDLK